MTHLTSRLSAAVATAGLTLAGLAAPASATRPASSPEPRIEDVTIAGTGCSKEDTVVALSSDNKALDVRYGAFAVQAGLVTKDDGTQVWVPHATKNCMINLKLAYHPNFTFALTAVTVRGLYDLAAAATAKHRTTFFFTGMPQTGVLARELKGRKVDTYDYTAPIPVPNWSECGATRAIHLATLVPVNASKSAKDTQSEVSLVDSSQRYQLQWRNC